jgi:hypothetical protein
MNSSLSGFSDGFRRVALEPANRSLIMFVFDRSAFPVLLPLALLVAVVLWSNRGEEAKPPTARSAPTAESSTVANVERRQSKNGG